MKPLTALFARQPPPVGRGGNASPSIWLGGPSAGVLQLALCYGDLVERKQSRNLASSLPRARHWVERALEISAERLCGALRECNRARRRGQGARRDHRGTTLPDVESEPRPRRPHPGGPVLFDAASPDSPSILAPLISVLALTGHEADARATLARYLANERTQHARSTHARTIARRQENADPNAEFERFAMRFKSGLRRAGMAEG